MCECLYLYLTEKVQRGVFFCALKVHKIKLRETVLKSVAKPSLCKSTFTVLSPW